MLNMKVKYNKMRHSIILSGEGTDDNGRGRYYFFDLAQNELLTDNELKDLLNCMFSPCSLEEFKEQETVEVLLDDQRVSYKDEKRFAA